jgi:predicted nucleotidyltransferase/biotin operon repressor
MPRPPIKPKSYIRMPLNTLLKSEASVRILREIFLQNGPVSLPLIAERTELGRSSVHRIAQTLEETGLLTAAGTGRTVLYQANGKHPFAKALKDLFLKEYKRYDDIVESIRDIVSGFSPLLAAWIYGSVARADDKVGSDFDLIIVPEDDPPSLHETRFRQALEPLEEEHLIRFAVTAFSLADVARLGKDRDPYWVEVERDAVVIEGLSPTELYRRAPGLLGPRNMEAQDDSA